MKKYYATLLVLFIVGAGLVACNAFKDTYDKEQQPVVPVEEPQTNTSVVPVTTDFTKDKYECTEIPNVKVKITAAATVTKNDGWTLSADQSTPLITALKLGPYTTRFNIKKTQDDGTMALSFVIKQTDTDKFLACEAGYYGLVKDGGMKTFETTINSGEITIESYNKEAGGGKVLNSGKYDFNFITKGDPKPYDIGGAFYIKTGTPVKQ